MGLLFAAAVRAGGAPTLYMPPPACLPGLSCPFAHAQLLEQHLQSGKPLPKMLYTVPAGSLFWLSVCVSDALPSGCCSAASGCGAPAGRTCGTPAVSGRPGPPLNPKTFQQQLFWAQFACPHLPALPDPLLPCIPMRCIPLTPAGQNPTGVSTALERKRAVYDICWWVRGLGLEEGF
jgi:hypothetical protein